MSYWYSREIDKAKDNLYGTTILIVIISSVPDYHVLESAIRRVTRCTRDRLVIILHCVGFANSETPRVNWHEIQRFYVWAYVESAALAQDMGKVLLDTQIVPRPPQAPSAKGSAVDAELAKKADVLYMFEGGASQNLPEGLSSQPNTFLLQIRKHFRGGLPIPPRPFTCPSLRPGVRHVFASHPA